MVPHVHRKILYLSVIFLHASPDKSGSRKRAVLLANFGRIKGFLGSCSRQFHSMSSIGRVPPDSSGDACFFIRGIANGRLVNQPYPR
jgi:hypothetical protein